MHYIQFIYSSVNGGFIKHVNIYDNQNQANTCNCIAIIWFDLQCCITLFAGEYSKKYLGSGHDIPNSASNIPGKIQTSEFYLPDMTMEMVITMRLTDKVCPGIYSGGCSVVGRSPFPFTIPIYGGYGILECKELHLLTKGLGFFRYHEKNRPCIVTSYINQGELRSYFDSDTHLTKKDIQECLLFI